jgi:hypothetical protein
MLFAVNMSAVIRMLALQNIQRSREQEMETGTRYSSSQSRYHRLERRTEEFAAEIECLVAEAGELIAKLRWGLEQPKSEIKELMVDVKVEGQEAKGEPDPAMATNWGGKLSWCH